MYDNPIGQLYHDNQFITDGDTAKKVGHILNKPEIERMIRYSINKYDNKINDIMNSDRLYTIKRDTVSVNRFDDRTEIIFILTSESHPLQNIEIIFSIMNDFTELEWEYSYNADTNSEVRMGKGLFSNVIEITENTREDDISENIQNSFNDMALDYSDKTLRRFKRSQ